MFHLSGLILYLTVYFTKKELIKNYKRRVKRTTFNSSKEI